MNSDSTFHIGERVTLRRLSPDDLENFQAYRTDVEVGRYQGWTPMSPEEAGEFLLSMSRAKAFVPGVWFQIGIADRLTDELIGDIGVCIAESEENAEIGFTLNPRLQGKGLATESILGLKDLLFSSTGIRRIVGVTDARNLASIRLMERLGMRRVQTVVATFRNEPCEEHTFELMRA